MKRLKKIVRVILLFVIGIILVVNAIIILTGRFYIYKGIKETYLKGRTGPTIYDFETFHTRKIAKGDKVFEFPKHPKYSPKLELQNHRGPRGPQSDQGPTHRPGSH